jgi:hypothetical protein
MISAAGSFRITDLKRNLPRLVAFEIFTLAKRGIWW